jgi:hypothetical protein
MDFMPLLVAGPISLLLAGIGLLFRRGRHADFVCLARLERSSPIRASGISGNGPVEIRGHARPSVKGPATAPLTGRKVVLYRLSALSREGRASNYQVVYVERHLDDFVIDDGSISKTRISLVKGQTGLFIDPDVIGPELGLITSDRYVAEATELHREWLAAKLGRMPPALRDLRFEERVIEVDQEASILGWPRASESGDDVVVSSSGPSLEKELLVWTGEKAELLPRLRRGKALVACFLAAGLLSLVIGLGIALTGRM